MRGAKVTYARRATPQQLGAALREREEREAAQPFTAFGEPTSIQQKDCVAEIGKTNRLDPTSAAISILLPPITDSEVGSVLLIVNVRGSTNGFVAQSMDGGALIDAASTLTNTTAYGSVMLQAVEKTQWVALWDR